MHYLGIQLGRDWFLRKNHDMDCSFYRIPWVAHSFTSTVHHSRGQTRCALHANYSLRSCFGNLFDPSNSLFIHI